jgi:addiction module RelE/StbE family toxin
MSGRIFYTAAFKRSFQARISHNEALVEDYSNSLDAFRVNPELVDDHELQEPMQDKRAFWVNNDYRVVYRVKEDDILFVDIGTHEQMYTR